MSARIQQRIAALAVLAAVTACGPSEHGLRVGAKDFTEQYLLAEMMAQLCEQEGIQVERAIPFGDTFVTFEALEHGQLDLYPEYTGTVLSLAGRPPPEDTTQALAEARRLVEPLGLRWGPRFGFANNYAMVMRRDRALALGVKRLSDLAQLPGGIRFATSESFLKRPIDGLGALARRYGLRIRETRVVPDLERAKVFQALVADEVDVAEAFSTDEQIDSFGLMLLEDDLGFFPPYEPAPLYRQEALERYPALQRAIDKLAGTIEAEQMRRLIRRVDTSGHPYPEVARAFLVENKLIPPSETKRRKEIRPLLLAVGEVAELGALPLRALRAVRRVMAKRDVRVRPTARPLEQVVAGEARLAVAAADAFYRPDGDDGLTPIEEVEALGVVGYHMGHLLTASGSRFHALTDLRRLAVGPVDGASHRIARHITRAHQLSEQLQLIPGGSLQRQLEALDRAEVDGLFLMVHPGHPVVSQAMRGGRYTLRPLLGDRAEARLLHLPFLRLARVPADTYENQPLAFETYSVQVVLAGPAPRVSSRLGEVGPGYIPGLDPDAPLPIASPIAQQLFEALGGQERIDPVLRSAAALEPRSTKSRTMIEPAPLDSLVNLLALGFVAYLMLLFLREERTRSRPEERG